MKKIKYAVAALVLTALVCAAAFVLQAVNEPVSVRAVIVSKLDDGRVIAPFSAVRQDENEKEYVYVWRQGEAYKRYILPLSECSYGFVLSDGLEHGEVLILTPDKISVDGERVCFDND